MASGRPFYCKMHLGITSSYQRSELPGVTESRQLSNVRLLSFFSVSNSVRKARAIPCIHLPKHPKPRSRACPFCQFAFMYNLIFQSGRGDEDASSFASKLARYKMAQQIFAASSLQSIVERRPPGIKKKKIECHWKLSWKQHCEIECRLI